MYPVSEDSLFFSEFLRNNLCKNINRKKIIYLDMGTGSGILAETALKSGVRKENVIAADIDFESLKFVSEKGLKTIHSDLFSNLSGKKFDLITFNAPYLPKNKLDKKSDIAGGKKGDEISLKFLKQAKEHLNKRGKIFLLVSSLTPMEKIKKFSPKIAAKKRIFFEELLILEFKKTGY